LILLILKYTYYSSLLLSIFFFLIIWNYIDRFPNSNRGRIDNLFMLRYLYLILKYMRWILPRLLSVRLNSIVVLEIFDWIINWRWLFLIRLGFILPFGMSFICRFRHRLLYHKSMGFSSFWYSKNYFLCIRKHLQVNLLILEKFQHLNARAFE
jgi:hypothetical protein